MDTSKKNKTKKNKKTVKKEISLGILANLDDEEPDLPTE